MIELIFISFIFEKLHILKKDTMGATWYVARIPLNPATITAMILTNI
jgi:hypothetical protein